MMIRTQKHVIFSVIAMMITAPVFADPLNPRSVKAMVEAAKKAERGAQYKEASADPSSGDDSSEIVSADVAKSQGLMSKHRKKGVTTTSSNHRKDNGDDGTIGTGDDSIIGEERDTGNKKSSRLGDGKSGIGSGFRNGGTANRVTTGNRLDRGTVSPGGTAQGRDGGNVEAHPD